MNDADVAILFVPWDDRSCNISQDVSISCISRCRFFFDDVDDDAKKFFITSCDSANNGISNIFVPLSTEHSNTYRMGIVPILLPLLLLLLLLLLLRSNSSLISSATASILTPCNQTMGNCVLARWTAPAVI